MTRHLYLVYQSWNIQFSDTDEVAEVSNGTLMFDSSAQIEQLHRRLKTKQLKDRDRRIYILERPGSAALRTKLDIASHAISVAYLENCKNEKEVLLPRFSQRERLQ